MTLKDLLLHAQCQGSPLAHIGLSLVFVLGGFLLGVGFSRKNN